MNLLKYNKLKSFYDNYSFWGALREAENYTERNKNNIAYLDIEYIKGKETSDYNVILKMWWED